MFNFFKSTLTVPKIKDLVNSPNEKYKNIYETISHNNYRDYENNSENNSKINNNINYTLEDILPPNTNTSNIIASANSNNMKNELKKFIKKQLVNDTSLI